jgi:hypothetical protein
LLKEAGEQGVVLRGGSAPAEAFGPCAGQGSHMPTQRRILLEPLKGGERSVGVAQGRQDRLLAGR